MSQNMDESVGKLIQIKNVRQIETESIIRVDTDFQRQVRELGGEIDRHSYRIGKLDLVCHLAGYVVNESTNKCS